MRKLVLIIALIVAVFGKIEAQYECGVTGPQLSARSLNTTGPTDYACWDPSKYYPAGNDFVTVKINFIFLEPSPHAGRYRNQDSTDAQQLVDSMNYYYAHIQQPTFPLPSPYTAGFFSSAKIKFVMKSYQHKVDSFHYFHVMDSTFKITDTNAVNFVYGLTADLANTCCGLGQYGTNLARFYKLIIVR